MIKIIFLDIDDTFLTPPYNSLSKVFKLMKKELPPYDYFLNRPEIEYHKSFPLIFKSKAHSWLFAIASIPFGFFKSYNIMPGIEAEKFKEILEDNRVMLLTQNPKLFKSPRVNRICELFKITDKGSISKKYIACGRLKKKDFSKKDYIKKICNDKNINLDEVLFIDDSLEEVKSCSEEGIGCLLVSRPYNKNKKHNYNEISHSEIDSYILKALGEK
jgi:hypothetical protein